MSTTNVTAPLPSPTNSQHEKTTTTAVEPPSPTASLRDAPDHDDIQTDEEYEENKENIPPHREPTPPSEDLEDLVKGLEDLDVDEEGPVKPAKRRYGSKRLSSSTVSSVASDFVDEFGVASASAKSTPPSSWGSRKSGRRGRRSTSSTTSNATSIQTDEGSSSKDASPAKSFTFRMAVPLLDMTPFKRGTDTKTKLKDSAVEPEIASGDEAFGFAGGDIELGCGLLFK